MLDEVERSGTRKLQTARAWPRAAQHWVNFFIFQYKKTLIIAITCINANILKFRNLSAKLFMNGLVSFVGAFLVTTLNVTLMPSGNITGMKSPSTIGCLAMEACSNVVSVAILTQWLLARQHYIARRTAWEKLRTCVAVTT